MAKNNIAYNCKKKLYKNWSILFIVTILLLYIHVYNFIPFVDDINQINKQAHLNFFNYAIGRKYNCYIFIVSLCIFCKDRVSLQYHLMFVCMFCSFKDPVGDNTGISQD